VKPEDLPFAFNRAPVWRRIAVLFAGPAFNFIFAIVVYWVLLMVGVPGFIPEVGAVREQSLAAQAGLRQGDVIRSVGGESVTTQGGALLAIVDRLVDDGIVPLQVANGGGEREINIMAVGRSEELTRPGALLTGLGFEFAQPPIPAVLGQILPDSVAAKAGLQSGDRVIRIDGEPVADFVALVKIVSQRPNRDTVFEIERQGQLLNVPLTVGERIENGKVVGRIGAGYAPYEPPESMRTVERFGPIAAIPAAIGKTWETCALSVKLMGKLVTGEVSIRNVSGPVGIANVAGFAAQEGPMEFFGFLCLISISIGILNLMPVPILDGGQIVYQVAELLKGAPVSDRAQIWGQQVGFVLLGLLLVLALFNDLAPRAS
jgi:regulator of sigma E protease